MLLDHRGRELMRRKQYGLTRGPLEYVLADPSPAAGQLVDAIGDTTISSSEEDEESVIHDSPRIN